jgi:hypothetical protein
MEVVACASVVAVALVMRGTLLTTLGNCAGGSIPAGSMCATGALGVPTLDSSSSEDNLLPLAPSLNLSRASFAKK